MAVKTVFTSLMGGAVSYPLHSQDFVRTGFQDVSPTLSARDYKDPKIVLEDCMETVKIKQANKQGFIECEVGGVADLSFPTSKTRRGRVIDKGNSCPTLQTDSEICKIEKGQIKKYRIRKLTPKECFRLMNFDDADFYAAESVNSDTQLYKQTGNSIVVACLCAIFSQLGIKGVTPWNEMTEEQKKELTRVNVCENPGYERECL